MHSHHTHEGAPTASATQQEADPLDAARALLAAEEQQRMDACARDLQEVLARHGMSLEVTPARIALVPLPPARPA